MVWPLSLLVLARLFFHRFDPARVRAAAGKAKGSWVGRLNAMAKPLARPLVWAGQWIVSRSERPSLFRSAVTDALTTVAAFPLAAVAVAGIAIAGLASDEASLFAGTLPAAFAGAAVAVADIACRERRAGTSALVFAAPLLRTRFVLWKFASILIVALAFLAVPLAKAFVMRPSSAIPLLVGVVFTCSAATALGIVSANPKTFIVAFLTFWYVATQDKGLTPSLDFAGWFGTATPLIVATYAGIAAALLALAHLFHARDLRLRY
jgi:hypothetical protein